MILKEAYKHRWKPRELFKRFGGESLNSSVRVPEDVRAKIVIVRELGKRKAAVLLEWYFKNG